MNVAIFGESDCLAAELYHRLTEKETIEVTMLSDEMTVEEMKKEIHNCDILFYFISRGTSVSIKQNKTVETIRDMFDAIKMSSKKVTIILVSSVEAETDSTIGTMIRECEEEMITWTAFMGQKLYIYRLHNVFGGACGSVENREIFNLCHEIMNNRENNNLGNQEICFEYIDDVIDSFLYTIETKEYIPTGYLKIYHSYRITLNQLRSFISVMKECENWTIPREKMNQLMFTLISVYNEWISGDVNLVAMGDNRRTK